MRDFNEIKAEILRRSDERIKEKKRKRRIYTAYVMTLCLCITVSALFLPKLFIFSDGAEDAAAPNENTDTYFTQETLPTVSRSEEMSEEGDYGDVVYALSAELICGEEILTLSSESDLIDLVDLLCVRDDVIEDEIETSDPQYADTNEDASWGWEENLPDLNPIPGDSDDEESFVFDVSQDESAYSYRIVISFSDGSSEEYTISGNILKNTHTGENRAINENERNSIIRLFAE